MRFAILALTAITVLWGETPTPRTVAYARVNPQPGQLQLFVAASDGSGERPLLTSADTDYDPVVGSRRRIDRVHVRSRRLG